MRGWAREEPHWLKWHREAQRKVYGQWTQADSALEHRKRSIAAFDVFRAELLDEQRWQNLEHPDYYARTWNGNYAIVDIPMHQQYTNRMKLQAVFVPISMAKNGIGTTAVNDVLRIVDLINELIEQGKEYKGKPIREPHFSIQIMPVPFYAEWTIATDQSRESEALKNWDDDAFRAIAADKERMDWKQLEKWYIELGFVRCDYCAEEYGPGTRTNRSREIGRVPLIYPESNLAYYTK